MGWLRDIFRPEVTSERTNERYQAAVDAADELIIANRSLQAQLEPFKSSPDPFGAIRKAARLAQAWEEPQEAAIHKGARR